MLTGNFITDRFVYILFVCSFVYILYVCSFVCLCVCLFICVFVCLFHLQSLETPFWAF